MFAREKKTVAMCTGLLIAVLVSAPAMAYPTYLPWVTAPTTTSVTVAWIDTDSTMAGSGVKYKIAGSSSSLTTKYESTAPLQYPTGGSTYLHYVTITGLSAGTRYQYRLLINNVETQPSSTVSWAYFKTSPTPANNNAATFTAALFGDYQNGASTVIANIKTLDDVYGYSDSYGPNLYINTGDIAGSTTDTYATYMSNEKFSWGGAFAPAPGNHDYDGSNETNWHYLFRRGANSYNYYSVTYSKIMFIFLDTGSSDVIDSTQVSAVNGYLQTAQNSSSIDHVVIIMHKSLYVSGGNHDPGIYQSNSSFLSVLGNSNYTKIRAVFSGHSHFYERIEHNSFEFPFFVIGDGGTTIDNGDPDTTPGNPEISVVKSYEGNPFFVSFYYKPQVVTTKPPVTYYGNMLVRVLTSSGATIEEVCLWTTNPSPNNCYFGGWQVP